MRQFFDFDTINMDKYFRILRSMLGPNLVCGIIDDQYETHWQSGPDGWEPADDILARAKDQAKDQDRFPNGLPGSITDLCPENYLALVHPLDLEYVDGDLYFMGLVQQGTPEVSRAGACQAFFSDVVTCIGSHYNLRMENETMVQELSQRYEELNFFYHTDDPVQGTATTEESLDNVVREITTVMTVDAAFLWLPDMGRWFFHTAGITGGSEQDVLLQKRVEKIFKTMKKTGQSMVVGETRGSFPAISSSGPGGMLVAPVLDSGLDAMGIIGCLRRRADQLFETGDRKLIEVTARRVKKIIHSELDELTGLANRLGFEKKLGMLQGPVSRIRDYTSVCLFNIDQFKLLNDAYGMATGDAVLKQTAAILKTHLRDQDFLARIKGDEFAIILFNLHSVDHGRVVLERIRKSIARNPYLFNNTLLHIKVRIGMVPITERIKEISVVCSKAEIAVEAAREKGGDCISAYIEGDPKLAEKQHQARTATQIEMLVENRQFVLFCQPIVPLQGGRMHYEILIRLKDEKGKIIAPYMFLPAAERYNKMPFIDQWVIEEACGLLKQSESFLSHADISWAINLSGQSLQDEVFLEYFLSFLSRLKFPTSWLNFEITETVAIRNYDRVINVMDQVNRMGFCISLDDFGSGYSSFGYLKRLPVTFLKIDGMFVQNLHKDPLDQVMVKSIATIAKQLNIQTIAEFVENQEILDFLKQWGIDYAQGYHTGKPVDLRDTLDRIQHQTSPPEILPGILT